nr:PREDICTED: uncharacterized protein LOC107398840 [Tribolium castaneum]|eukprot:XP_015839846.1 PREDICTED: uncharacterized protein LOC107398840 [Tribolium castaneum]
MNEILKPLHVATDILGINVYKVTPKGLIYSKLKILRVVLYQTVWFISTCSFIKNYQFLNVARASAITLVVFTRVFLWGLNMMAILYLMLFRNGKMILIRQKLSEIDNKLEALGLKERLSNLAQRHKKTLTVLILIEIFALNLSSEIVTHILLERNDFFASFVVLQYSRLFSTTFLTYFLIQTLIVQKRFELINELFQKGNKTILWHLVSCHLKLQRLVKILNSMFDLQILITVTFYFAQTVLDLYTGITVALFETNKGIFVFIALKNALQNIIELFYLTRRCSELCIQANLAKKLVLDFEIDIQDEEKRNFIVASGLKLSNNKLEITALRMFSINYSLLHSVRFQQSRIDNYQSDSFVVPFSRTYV